MLDVRRAGERFSTRTSWLDSRHSFSFGRHYDPQNTRHGLLLVNNDDLVQPDTGYEPHAHRDVEIITWVVQGSLVHQDSTGHRGVLHPGLVQRMSAGTGISHSENNGATGRPGSEPVRFVQMWLPPDEDGLDPGYQQCDVADQLLAGDLVPLASGRPQHDAGSAIRIHHRHAALHAARLQPGQSVQLPDAPYLHLFVTYGAVSLEGAGALGTGDAVRFTASGGHRLTALEPCEVLVWEMHAGPR